MDKERALKRIRKCLALSNSDNPNEAAAAMRQARALMQRFNLTDQSVAASAVDEVSVAATTSRRPPMWEMWLVNLVGTEFQCSTLRQWDNQRRISWVFLGTGDRATIAAYVFEVLLRQLLQSRERSLVALRAAGYGEMRRASRLFCEGWVMAVSKTVQEFAGTPATVDPAVEAFLSENDIPSQPKHKPRKKKSEKVSKAEYLAFMEGMNSGSAAQLHNGVDAEYVRTQELDFSREKDLSESES